MKEVAHSFLNLRTDKMIEIAVIPAAGFGTRMEPLTTVLPEGDVSIRTASHD